MKILIVTNCFKRNFGYLPRFLNKFLIFYSNIKLKYIINALRKRYHNATEINVLNAGYQKLDVNNLISFSDLRFNLDRDKYIKLRNKIINTTKQNLSKLFKNLKNLNYKGISIAEILEIDLIVLFNEYIGHYELLKELFKTKQFDRIIFFNFGSNIFPIFRSLNSNNNIEICKDNFLIKSQKLLKLFNVLKYLFIILGLFLKKRLLQNTNQDYALKSTILFLTDTKNQFYSIKPVYDGLLEYKNVNTQHYSCENYLSLNRITRLLKYLLKIRKLIIFNKDNITSGLKYETFNLDSILKIFYDYNLFVRLIKIFTMLNNLIKFIGDNHPVLVVLANDYSNRGRLEIGYFKLKNIPIVYIPHAGIPIMEELATRSEVSYITVPGELEKEYLVNKKGEPIEKVVVTGRPRYEHFHKGEIEKLIEVKDIFNTKKYEFNSNKFTILLTTNPIDERSNEKIISSVINSLKELNMVDNLIIKLHPREDGKVHKKILRKLAVNPIIVKDYDILQLIKSSDLLLSRVSNTVIESMIIGTPVILLDFINVNFIFTSRYVFTEDKSLIRVKNQKELTDALYKLIKNKDFYIKYSVNLRNLSEGYSFYDEKQTPTEKIIDLFFNEIRGS
ncbi:MAG: hypothetical protein ACFFHD_00830 [Promethearchaeota archaeon]